MRSTRRLPSRLLTGRFCSVPIKSDSLLCVDESGIYAIITKDSPGAAEYQVGVGRYSFDYKCFAKYWHDADEPTDSDVLLAA